MLASISDFWRRHPALLYGLALWIGCSAALSGSLWLSVPVLFILAPAATSHTLRMRLFLALLLGGATFAACQVRYEFPDLADGTVRGRQIDGQALITIDSIHRASGHTGQTWVMRGAIKRFVDGDGHTVARNVPYSWFARVGPKRPVADKEYWVHATLTGAGRHRALLKRVHKWDPVKGSSSFAERRYRAKRWIVDTVAVNSGDRRAAAFLGGLATGQFSDKLLGYEFSRFGLQHLMAISGFHFAIIAAMLNLLFRLLLPHRLAVALLAVTLGGYFLLLGPSPSIVRAWLMATLVIVATLAEREATALNSLGVAMMALLVWDPLLAQHLGFQFSFAVTAAILLLYSPVESMMRRVIPKRRLASAITMGRVQQHIYVVMNAARQMLALTIAVHLVAVPLMLFHFHQFALLGLVYNLFFPFLVSFSMLFMMISALVTCIVPGAGPWLFGGTAAFTDGILALVIKMPMGLDLVWHVHEISVGMITCWLSAVAAGAVVLRACSDRSRQEGGDWQFV